MDDSMNWDVLIAAGGMDLHDIMKEAGVETQMRERKDEIPYRARVEAVEAGENNDPPASDALPEQPHVPAVTAITPTVWDVGIQMIRNTISKFSNYIV